MECLIIIARREGCFDRSLVSSYIKYKYSNKDGRKGVTNKLNVKTN